jgi:hypothetical protein
MVNARIRTAALESLGLGFLLALSLHIRLWLLAWWNSYHVGDVVNFVQIAQELAKFSYPVSDKRLPLYPFLILLGHLVAPTARWEMVAIGISIAASIITLLLLYCIGRTLRFHPIAMLLSLLLYTSMQPFLAYSIRGYADTTLSALLAGAILATLYVSKRWWVAPLAGLVFGALALTRYEGAVAAVVLFPFVVWQVRRHWQRLVLFVLTGILAVLPYILICQQVGRSLLPTTYLAETASEEEGYGAGSAGEFWEHYHEIWERLGLYSVTILPPILWGELRDDPLGFHRHVVKLFAWPPSILALVGIAGLLVLIKRSIQTSRAGFFLGLITVPYVAASIPIAWYAPYIRYDAMLAPMLVLLAGAGFSAFFAFLGRAALGPYGRALRFGTLSFLLVIGVGVWFLAATQDTVQSLRKSASRDYAFYQAFHQVRQLPGRILFEQAPYIIYTYLGDRALAASDIPTEGLSADEAWEKLRDARVEHVVTAGTPDAPFAFVFSTDPPAGIEVVEVGRYHVIQGNTEENDAVIYGLTYTP